MTVEFTVYGRPEPQGSTRAFLPKGWKRPVVTSDNPRVRPFRQQIARTAVAVMDEHHVGRIVRPEPVALSVCFFFAKPRRTPKRIERPTVKPDVDKLLRAVLDGLAGIVFDDDAQVVEASAMKSYGQPERTEIRVSTDGTRGQQMLLPRARLPEVKEL